MKRLMTIGLIAALAVMILLAGCGKKAETTGPIQATEPVKPAEAPKAPEAPATAPAATTESAPAESEPVQVSDLGIDEKMLDLGENPDTGASAEEFDLPTVE